MHSYLQRHLRTHASGGVGGVAKEGAKVTKGGGASGTMGGPAQTLSLSMNTPGGLSSLFPDSSGNSTLLLSPSNLDIPLNTSQNYFMIQTPSGLQLIPLSNPTPTQPPPPPPPPPPPQPQSQNYLLLQCQGTNGSQPSLILVPTSSNPVSAEPQPLPVVQTIPALQSVLGQAQTQITQFQTVQTQPRYIVTNTNSTNTQVVTTAPCNSTLTRPILGKLTSTKTGRSRRGRKPKAASQKPGLAAPTVSQSAAVSAAVTKLSTTVSTPIASSMLSQPPACANQAAPTSTSAPTVVKVEPKMQPEHSMTLGGHLSEPSAAWTDQTTPAEDKSSDPLPEERFVLCFEKDGKKEEREIGVDAGGDGGRSYVLQFEGGAERDGGEREGGGRREESYVLHFQADGEREGDGGKEQDGMVSLNFQDWGSERQAERTSGLEEGVEGEGESFILHFQAADAHEEGAQPGAGYPEAQGNGLGLSCPPAQALVPLGGQEMVFQLEDEAKMVGGSGSGDNVQMIALIEGEGASSRQGGAFGPVEGTVGESREQMEGIFQLEGGEGIVIIEVSTSSLREGGMEEGGGGVTLERIDGKEMSDIREVTVGVMSEAEGHGQKNADNED